MGHLVILERERELAALSAAASAGAAGRGGLVLVEGPAGIGKTTLLRAACDRCDGLRVLTARGLALERGFPYGIVRQLLEPVRGEAGLLDGAAGLAARVFEWTEAGPVEDDVPYATMHGLYWLVANLAAAQPLVLAVDDAHWADPPSLRWLAHLAARLDGLPATLFLAARDGPDEPALLDELRVSPGVTRLGLGPLSPDATAALVRRRLGDQANQDLCREFHFSTGGNPFLLETLARALDEPPDLAARPGLELDLGIALARERNPEAVTALREAVRLARAPAERAHAALLAARVLGIWGYHDNVIAICEDVLADDLDPGVTGGLEAELFQNRFSSGQNVGQAWDQVRGRACDPSAAWRINGALAATVTGRPVADLDLDGVAPDSLTAVFALLVLIWNDDLVRAGGICDAVLAGARRRGSMSMVAHASCLRSMIMRRLGQLEEAAADARVALDFKLATSPPAAVAWAAVFGVDALTCLGRLDEADAMAETAAGRKPPPGWIHTVLFRQARGALRAAQHRPEEALADLLAAAEGWRDLHVTNPAIASWRAAAVAAYRALGQHDEAAALAAEHLSLARASGHPVTLGIALRVHGTTRGQAADLAEAVRLLEATPARYELALALADHGASLRRSGQRPQAREPLLRALDLAERTGAAALAAEVRQELLAVGARPRRAALTGPDALTSTERRVAALAADGLSNRQIAEHLFVTQATVETHLRHAFRKLGITTRTDLPRLDIAR